MLESESEDPSWLLTSTEPSSITVKQESNVQDGNSVQNGSYVQDGSNASSKSLEEAIRHK